MQKIKQEQKIVVGFKVVNNDFLEQLKEKIKIKGSSLELLKIIVEDYNDILSLYFKLFLIEKDGKTYFKFNKRTKIHYEFARKFLNFSVRKPARTPFIDLQVLKGFYLRKFTEWFTKNKEWIKNIKDCLNQYEKQKTLNLKEAALTIKNINSNEGIVFVEKLTSEEGINFIGEKMEEYFRIQQIINKKARQIKENLLKIENVFLAKTESGLNIFNGSLNYFSVNKRLDNYKKERRELEEKLEEKIGGRYDKDLNNIIPSFKFFERFSNYFNNYGYNDLSNVTLKNFKKILKKIKSEEKSRFYKNICNINFKDLKKNYPLFEFFDKKTGKGKNKFKEFQQYSYQILNGKGNKDIAKKRGSLLNIYCDNYKKIVKLYEKVAKDYGNINAKLKAIENAIDNIRKLQYWLLFAQIDGQLKLLAIPKSENLENLHKANRFLGEKQDKGEIKILCLNSFTLKALNKLLFREDSSFRRGLSREINRDKLEEMKMKYLQSRSNRAELSDQELVNFYQEVLKTEYAQKNLKFDFNKIEKILNKNYSSVEKFRIDLERRLYGFDEFYFSPEKYQEFLKRFNIIEFDIVMIDNKKNPQNRWHTKLWPYFWGDKNQGSNFQLRINPEIKFFYKEKDEEKIGQLIDKYSKEKVFSESFKHRALEDKLIAKIIFELNIPSERIEFSFKERIEIEREIEKFNQKFNKINTSYQDAYYFGIDRGTNEFVSLGVYQTNGKSFRANKIIAYKIKDEYLGQVITSQRQWFSDFNKYFEKTENDYLDLTVAKLVGDKIILNSEWQTLLEITKLHYKNKIFEVVDELVTDEIFIREENANIKFFVKTTKQHKDGVVDLGFYRNNFAEFKKGKIDEIKQELTQYIKEVKKDKNNSKYQFQFDKIVNYKNALAANVAGVINFLRKKYKNSYIVFENLDIKTVQKQSTSQSQAIHRQLEWVLLNKLKKQELVPSDISKQIIFRDKKEAKQFGAVLFLSEKGTSKICPNCEEKNMGHNKRAFENNKFGKRIIKCKKCGAEFYADEIACINLAKNGFKFLAQYYK